MKDQISSVSHKAVIGGKKPSLRNLLLSRGLRKKSMPTMDKPTMKSRMPSMRFPKVY